MVIDMFPEVTPENIDEIVAEILKDLPEQAIVKEERYGNTYYGYSVGWTIDRLNEIVGPHQWNLVPIKTSMEKSEGRAYNVAMLVGVAIGPPKAWAEDEGPQWYDEEKWAQFTVIPIMYREAWGQSTNMSYGDALKGAMSDGAKKALSMIGLGVKAYKGLIGGLPEDYMYQPTQNKKNDGKLPWE